MNRTSIGSVAVSWAFAQLTESPFQNADTTERGRDIQSALLQFPPIPLSATSCKREPEMGAPELLAQGWPLPPAAPKTWPVV